MDVWFREDVARVVRAARLARCQVTAGLGWEPAEVLSREMAAYWRGYAAALSTIGAAFGLEAADEKLISGWGNEPGAADEKPQRVSGWGSELGGLGAGGWGLGMQGQDWEGEAKGGRP